MTKRRRAARVALKSNNNSEDEGSGDEPELSRLIALHSRLRFW
jgi:hypothetical protein